MTTKISAALIEPTQKSVINLSDYLPDNYVPGRTDSAPAWRLAIAAAISSKKGVIQVDGRDHLALSEITIPATGIEGGISILGPSVNSQGIRANLIQKDIATNYFKIRGENFRASGLSATVFAGCVLDSIGNPITVLSTGSNTLTLSSNPWLTTSPVIWTGLTSPQLATDGTPYSSAIRFNVMGAWLASGATFNLDGTVTLTGVRGTAGTATSSLSGTVGFQVSAFISLAHVVSDVNFANPTPSIFFMDVRENQFFDHLWFNQVGSCFGYDQYGSGAGFDTLTGNSGFHNHIVCDQVGYYITAAGGISNLQASNIQLFGARHGIKAANGDFSESVLTNIRTYACSKFLEVSGGNMVGVTLVGCAFEPITDANHTYINGFFSISGTIQDTTFTGNTFGRSTNGTAPFTFIAGDGFTFVGNSVASHNEGGSGGFFNVTGSSLIRSTLQANTWASRYSSSTNRIVFNNNIADLTGSIFGWEIAKYTNHSQLGWQAPTLINSWSQAAGTSTVGFKKTMEGTVKFKGSITGGSSGTIAFTLPSWAVPAGFERRDVRVTNGNGQVEISPSGSVTITFSTANSWVDLGSVSFDI